MLTHKCKLVTVSLYFFDIDHVTFLFVVTKTLCRVTANKTRNKTVYLFAKRFHLSFAELFAFHKLLDP